MSLNIPFLWDYVKLVNDEWTQSGGQERPMTKTVAEENSPNFIKIRYKN